MNKLLKNKKKGFTLIELIIVIAIIAILAAVAVPKFGQIQRNSKIKADIATAKNLHSVASQYLAEADAHVPASNITTAVEANVDGGKINNTKLYNTPFVVNVDATGNITVSASNGTNSIQIYPDNGTNAWQ